MDWIFGTDAPFERVHIKKVQAFPIWGVDVERLDEQERMVFNRVMRDFNVGTIDMDTARNRLIKSGIITEND